MSATTGCFCLLPALNSARCRHYVATCCHHLLLLAGAACFCLLPLIFAAPCCHLFPIFSNVSMLPSIAGLLLLMPTVNRACTRHLVGACLPRLSVPTAAGSYFFQRLLMLVGTCCCCLCLLLVASCCRYLPFPAANALILPTDTTLMLSALAACYCSQPKLDFAQCRLLVLLAAYVAFYLSSPIVSARCHHLLP